MNKVSVIVNFHNGEKYLRKCLESILSQEYKNFEIILWDNNSNDNSSLIIKEFNDERINYYYNNIKVPLYKARNLAIEKASGDLVAFLDCDDWWEKNYLSSRKNIFENYDYDFFYSNTNFYFEKNKKIKIYKKYDLPSGYIFDSLSKDYFIIISGVIFRKKIFTDYRMFNDQFNIIGDYDFIMDISKIYKAHGINSPLVSYRIHDRNFSKLNSKMFYEEFQKWFDQQYKNNNIKFLKNLNFFKKKLSFYKINSLLNSENKNIKLLLIIFAHQNFLEKLKFLILFLLPKKYYKYLKK